VAALVVGDGPVQRDDLAVRLWPDTPAARAMARLRQTLWRLNQATGGTLLHVTSKTVALGAGVRVDYRDALSLVAPPYRLDTIATDHTGLPRALSTLRHPLLTGWDHAWLRPFQEEWELYRVQALERMAEICLARRQHSAALELADAAARADPLREGPQRIAIQSCLRVGEVADAHRRFRRYKALLDAELGVSPSCAIPRLLSQALERDPAMAADF
jgi:DNA-binding SARP family transcriptional activator